jgi:hypothetical protein
MKIQRKVLTLILVALLFFIAGCGKEKQSGTETPTPKPTEVEDTTPASTPTPAPTSTAEESSRIEEWLENTTDADKVILTYDQIKEYNKKLVDKSQHLIDILEAEVVVNGNTVKDYINGSYIPSLPKYDKSGEITNQDVVEIKKNFNTDAIPAQVEAKYGVIVYRADLKSIPTRLGFYDSPTDEYYDRIQETELPIGMPVLVLHESLDKDFLYIQTYFYRGWIRADAVAICESRDAWLEFADLKEFITITTTLIPVGKKGAKADMGCAFPLVKENNDSYTVKLPERNNDGKLEVVETDISKKDAVKGYLPYTKGNFITLALKFVGTPYGWGGLNEGHDCSGYLVCVFRTFGFKFPRNTSQQSGVIGDEVINLEGLSKDDIIEKVSEIEHPACLFKKGHVLLYLGVLDDVPYIVHSPSGGQYVTEEPLENVISNLVNATIIK